MSAPAVLRRVAPRRLPTARRVERDLFRLLRLAGITPASGCVIARRAFWVGLETGAGLSSQIRRVQTHVDLHVGEVRTLDDLARVAGLSRFRFAHRFRDEVGEAPWAYVRRIRDLQAVRRLEAGARPAEVAFELGYADQAHLTRSLQRRYGQTPAEIRASADGSKDVQDAGVEGA